MKRESRLRPVMGLVATCTLVVGVNCVAENPVITFHQNGILEYYSAAGTSPNACLVQPDGGIVAAGQARLSSGSLANNFFTTRLIASPSATFDSSFHTNGAVTTAVGTLTSSARAAGLFANGEIVEAGTYAYPVNKKTTGNGIGVVKYQSNGALDSAFGSGGIFNTVVSGTTNAQATSVVVDSSNRVVVAGYSTQTLPGSGGTLVNAITLLRLTPSGKLDSSFGSAGVVVSFVGSSTSLANGIAVSGGNLIVIGKARNANGYFNFALAEYSASGSLVPAFGTNGIVLDQVGSTSAEANAVTIDAAGRILVGGWSEDANGNQSFALARYLANGARDTAFGTGGVVQTSFTGGDAITSFAVQANVPLSTNSPIVVVGTTGANTTPIALARYNSDGSLDTSFNSTGTLLTTVPNNPVSAFAALQANQQIIVTGETDQVPSNTYTFRLNTDGSSDTSF